MGKNRVAIYFDGGNFYFKLKSLGIKNTTCFNYGAFCDYLSQERKIISRRYYVGLVKSKKNNKHSQFLREQQQKLFAFLESKHKFVIKKGYLMENNGVYHEKGVDVQMAIDILIGAYEDLYDTAILVSSDTDLIPAIKKVKYLGKNIEYIGFAHNPSLGLQRYVNLSRLLIKNELKQFEFNKR